MASVFEQRFHRQLGREDFGFAVRAAKTGMRKREDVFPFFSTGVLTLRYPLPIVRVSRTWLREFNPTTAESWAIRPDSEVVVLLIFDNSVALYESMWGCVSPTGETHPGDRNPGPFGGVPG